MWRRIYEWLDERYQLQALVEFMSHKYVPMHRHAIWYYCFVQISFWGITPGKGADPGDRR
jgi:hypothetical protein